MNVCEVATSLELCIPRGVHARDNVTEMAPFRGVSELTGPMHASSGIHFVIAVGAQQEVHARLHVFRLSDRHLHQVSRRNVVHQITHEQSGFHPVQNAMITGKGHRHHRTYGRLSLDGYDTIGDPADG